MPEVVLLTEAQLRDIVRLDAAAIEAVEGAFVALASGQVVMPPILRLDIADANGEVDVKTAYMPGLPSFAIKISPGFFDNPRLGLPSVNGMMMLLSARTGLVEAALFDNGYLTDVRTAAAGAVAARHLSRPDSTVAAILGAGMQARMQLEALTLVRPIRSARIWARDIARAKAAAGDLRQRLGIDVTALADAEAAVTDADIIVTTTPARTPILMARWLQPGQHLTAMGSDAESKNEIDPAAFSAVDLYVPDRLSQTRVLGELHHAIRAGIVSAGDAFPDLGAIASGRAVGRTSADQITFADLTGTGVQDTAIATLARSRSRERGAGTTFVT